LVFRPRRNELRKEWRKFHGEEIHSLLSTPHILGVTKYVRMNWAGYVAELREGEMHTEFSSENLKRGDYFGDLGLNGRIILKYIK
jgi:hypothetical protein